MLFPDVRNGSKADIYRLTKIVASLRSLTSNPRSVSVWETGLKTGQLALGVVVATPCSTSKPMPVADEVATIERVHGQVLCANGIAPTERAIGEHFLTPRVGHAARLLEAVTKHQHARWVMTESKMPEDRRSIAFSMLIRDRPITLPKAIVLVHPA